MTFEVRRSTIDDEDLVLIYASCGTSNRQSATRKEKSRRNPRPILTMMKKIEKYTLTTTQRKPHTKAQPNENK